MLKIALRLMTTHALKELHVSDRIQKNLVINLHMKHYDTGGEAKISEWTNRYSPREFDVFVDWHRLLLDEYGREKGDEEWFHDVLKTLAHEMVHVSDYISGELTWRDKGLLWRGKNYEAENLVEYYRLPYEVKAFGMEKGLLISFLIVWNGLEKFFGSDFENL